MDDIQLGARFRAVRMRLGWRQTDVAARAGVSSSLVSLVERGHLDRLALATLRRIAGTLDIRIDMVARWRGGELERLVNAAHETLREEVARLLSGLSGWTQSPEVSFAVYGERGVIDILALHERTGALLVIELKTELVSLEDLLATMDRRLRLARAIAGERGWAAKTVSAWVVLGESDTNRRRVRAHATTLRSAFPAGGHAMRSWLRRPTGPIRALSFWANSNAGGGVRRVAARKRVRRLSGGRSGR